MFGNNSGTTKIPPYHELESAETRAFTVKHVNLQHRLRDYRKERRSSLKDEMKMYQKNCSFPHDKFNDFNKKAFWPWDKGTHSDKRYVLGSQEILFT